MDIVIPALTVKFVEIYMAYESVVQNKFMFLHAFNKF